MITTESNFWAEQKTIAPDHIIWRCIDLKTKGEFIIHVMDGKKLFITFFRSKNKAQNQKVRSETFVSALIFIAEIIKNNGVIAEILIKESNYTLRKQCKKAGFKNVGFQKKKKYIISIQ